MKCKKYAYVNGEKVYVTNEVNKALKKQKNREEYVSKLYRENINRSFIELIGLENIKDKSVDVEKIVHTNILVEKLKIAMKNLSNEELEIVRKL